MWLFLLKADAMRLGVRLSALITLRDVSFTEGGEWFQSVNHAHEDCADRRGEGHDRGRQTQPSDPAAGRHHPIRDYITLKICSSSFQNTLSDVCLFQKKMR